MVKICFAHYHDFFFVLILVYIKYFTNVMEMYWCNHPKLSKTLWPNFCSSWSCLQIQRVNVSPNVSTDYVQWHHHIYSNRNARWVMRRYKKDPPSRDIVTYVLPVSLFRFAKRQSTSRRWRHARLPPPPGNGEQTYGLYGPMGGKRRANSLWPSDAI